MRFLLQLSYDGTNYHGWQIQPNAITVQETIQNKMSILLQSEIKITGSGRTDAKVHALNQFAHFDYNKNLPENFIQKINLMLPEDIVIKKVFKVPENFSARHSAIKRAYLYFITTQKNPFIRNYSWFVYKPLNIPLMNEQAKLLIGEKDFTSFSKKGSQVKHNFCKVHYAKFRKWKYGYVFKIEANRFLRAMVRFIVGTLVEIENKKTSVEEILLQKDNKFAGKLAPPTGLFLANVEYPENNLTLIQKI